MTSTNMFQGLDNSAKPSSRVLRPPGGSSSNLFGGYEEDSVASRKPNKMASAIFAPPEEPQGGPRRSNPPGGKSSGIFGEPYSPVQQQKHVPPGGPTSNIFGVEYTPVQSPARSHQNNPKDNLCVGAEPEPLLESKDKGANGQLASQAEVKDEVVSPPAVPAQEEPASIVPPSPASEPPLADADQSSDKNHEPHLGPKPRSHNRVLNPPGGKSSVVFY